MQNNHQNKQELSRSQLNKQAVFGLSCLLRIFLSTAISLCLRLFSPQLTSFSLSCFQEVLQEGLRFNTQIHQSASHERKILKRNTPQS